MNRLHYELNSIKWFVVRIYNHYARPKRWECTRKTYGGVAKLTVEDGISLIAKKIEANEPFMAARFGSNELSAMTEGYAVERGWRKTVTQRTVDYMRTLAGFFPSNQENIVRFSKLMLECLPCTDILGIWYNPNEDYFIRYFMPDVSVTPIAAINELHRNNWTSALKGKKVVVVSPFKETILSQYKRREKLFSNPELLPEFDLRVVKAVQTIAHETDDRFDNWFDALDYMFQEIMSEDFDIALLGCGAYGFPLAAKIKQSKKSAIHVGGGLQLLFGIKGGKWDNTVTNRYYNEYWVRPNESETPKHYKKVENGCYW
ncbi:MAG: hypothetical protein MJZ85_06230 [Bacteroidales bacterium]|nr:hypothetical protein [Bacteroidales bacterium]